MVHPRAENRILHIQAQIAGEAEFAVEWALAGASA
jgi:hypothetical protein